MCFHTLPMKVKKYLKPNKEEKWSIPRKSLWTSCKGFDTYQVEHYSKLSWWCFLWMRVKYECGCLLLGFFWENKYGFWKVFKFWWATNILCLEFHFPVKTKLMKNYVEFLFIIFFYFFIEIWYVDLEKCLIVCSYKMKGLINNHVWKP